MRYFSIEKDCINKYCLQRLNVNLTAISVYSRGGYRIYADGCTYQNGFACACAVTRLSKVTETIEVLN